MRKINFPNTGGPSKAKPGEDLQPRVESGPVQFGDDWPGLFLRGDHCMSLLMSIKAVQEQYLKTDKAEIENPHLHIAMIELTDLAETIESSVLK